MAFVIWEERRGFEAEVGFGIELERWRVSVEVPLVGRRASTQE